MPRSLTGFDATQIEPIADFEPIPSDNYVAVIIESEFKPTRAETGTFLQLTLQVIEGEFKNRLLWDRLNLDNPNAKTVQIAKAVLSAICRAVGIMAPKDSADLHNLPLVIKVRSKRRDDTGELTNVIKGYAQKEAPPAAPVAATPSSTPPAAPVAATPSNTPPWLKS